MTNYIECITCPYVGPGYTVRTVNGNSETYCNYCIRDQVSKRAKDEETRNRLLEALKAHD